MRFYSNAQLLKVSGSHRKGAGCQVQVELYILRVIYCSFIMQSLIADYKTKDSKTKKIFRQTQLYKLWTMRVVHETIVGHGDDCYTLAKLLDRVYTYRSLARVAKLFAARTPLIFCFRLGFVPKIKH